MDDKFQFANRQEIVVWLYSTKKLNALKKLGYVYYVSRKMKYAILYITSERTEETMKKIQKLPFVREVKSSPRQEISMNFDAILPKMREEIAQKQKAEQI